MSRKQSIIKTFTWRIVASTDTFIIAYICSAVYEMNGTKLAATIAGIEILNKLILYYIHERAWEKLPEFITKSRSK